MNEKNKYANLYSSSCSKNKIINNRNKSSEEEPFIATSPLEREASCRRASRLSVFIVISLLFLCGLYSNGLFGDF